MTKNVHFSKKIIKRKKIQSYVRKLRSILIFFIIFEKTTLQDQYKSLWPWIKLYFQIFHVIFVMKFSIYSGLIIFIFVGFRLCFEKMEYFQILKKLTMWFATTKIFANPEFLKIFKISHFIGIKSEIYHSKAYSCW